MHYLESEKGPEAIQGQRNFAARHIAAVAVLLLSVCVGWAQNSNKTTTTKPAFGNTSPSGHVAATVPDPASARGEGYVIGPEDVLSINVWKDPEISGSVPVRPDGRITVPLLGDLVASGQTPPQLAAEIRGKLKNYMLDPEVQVIVTQVKSHSFNVVGKVTKPGAYELAKPTTVLDAVALAGAFQDFAKTNKIYVLRKMPDGSQKMLPFNYKQVIKGRQLDQNIELQSGDTVVVP